jgi:hypothetical protein
MNPVWAGCVYGIAGFFLGFVFGTFRELVLIPAFGVVAGQWIEFVPLLLFIILLGIWIAERGAFSGFSQAIVCGLVAVCVLLAQESILAIFVFGQSVEQYLSGFNISEGKLFPFGLLAMALTPAVFLFVRRISK